MKLLSIFLSSAILTQATRLSLDPEIQDTLDAIKESESQLHKGLGNPKMLQQQQRDDENARVEYFTNDFARFQEEEHAEMQESLNSMAEAKAEIANKKLALAKSKLDR